MTVATGQKNKKHVVLTKFWVWQRAIATPFCHKKNRWNFVEISFNVWLIIALQHNLQRNPNEIPTKHFLWQNVLPHVANEIPTKFQRIPNNTFLSQNWLYPIYCKWRIIMLEPHSNWLINWRTNQLTDWLTDWLTECLIDWLTDWLADWLTDWLTD